MSTVIEAHPCVDCGLHVERELPVPGAFGREVLLAVIRCPDCTDVLLATEAAEEAEAALGGEERRFRANIAASGIPDALRDLSWDAMTAHQGQESAIAAARHWAAEGGGLVLTGPVGVGKTRIAATATWTVLAKRMCCWLSAPLLFARLGSGLGSTPRDNALQVLTSKTALVIDDFDKARPTEYGAEHVFLAVDGRVTNNAPLLVTTNLSLGELAAKFPEPYGEAIASRLAGYCTVETVSGPDQRLA